MLKKIARILKEKCSGDSYEKLQQLRNPHIDVFIGEYVELCNPASVFVRTDSLADSQYIRARSTERSEEKQLTIEGHTVHFDGMQDQGRDKDKTKFLKTPELNLGPNLNCIDREEGLKEVRDLLRNSMNGKEMYVLFLCLGPVKSDFSLYGIQITDSAYVAHSEDILYRPAYEVFRSKGDAIEFFRYVHSAGELERGVSKNYDKKRIYTDFVESTVYSVNTQYAGNTLGLKKLSLRLTIQKADKNNWLSEHMFLMNVYGPNNRKTYFTGAFPSACGKTSTCMIKGGTIVGDDIAFLRKREGKVYSVNVERGIFGIIKDVNPEDDPLISDVLTKPGEVIFSNILIKNGEPYWLGDGRTLPTDGENFSGMWTKGKRDDENNPIPYSHPNARYTIKLEELDNCDLELENPKGVEVSGIVYGGRDSDTLPPVFQSFDWTHGVITIASSLESETTSATIGKQGVRSFNLMANLDFLSIPLGKYVQNHLDFKKDLEKIPLIFGVNYFQRNKSGEYMTGMHDKRVWLQWIELRVHNEVPTIETPIGLIPKYDDLKRLFKQVLNKAYTLEAYKEQFTLRVPENLKKIERIMALYRAETFEVPRKLFETLEAQQARLENIRKKHGDYIDPSNF
jgi:phosphoenolpyruvate carboxykinase (GTP)